MGDYDLVPGILRKMGFALAFERVAMQPGRPTVFGQQANVYCCGLPGNPVSSYVVFEILVKPFLYRLMGHDVQPIVVQATLAAPVMRRKSKRQINIPVRFTSPGQIEPIDYHGPAHINAMTQAEGLITIGIGQSGYDKGASVHVRLLSAQD